MAVTSCTLILNELDLLDLKIAEELGSVDRMVIAEANMTHQGESKPTYLEGNPKYQHPKIELKILKDQFGPSPRKNEWIQRNALVTDFEDDDVFIVTDVDEIIKREDIPGIVEAARTHGLVRLEQNIYHYKINLLAWGGVWIHPLAVTGSYLHQSKLPLTRIRNNTDLGVPIPTQGKHFSYLGDPEQIAFKMRSFSHWELNVSRFTDLEQIEGRIRDRVNPLERGVPLRRVELDESYPRTILEHPEIWEKYTALESRPRRRS
jgi:hypothetical protein